MPQTDIEAKEHSIRHRVRKALALRTGLAEEDASVGALPQITNGDEERYSDKCGTYTKGVKQAAIGVVDPAAYRTFKKALDRGTPQDFEQILLGGPRTLNGPQAGLAYYLSCLDAIQFAVPPAPALASDWYATELVELYWASLLRDTAFTDYGASSFAKDAAKELSGLPEYKGPRDGSGQVTTDLLFRGGFPGETIGPYLSQFAVLATSLGALPITQRYTTSKAGVDFMLDPTTFQQVQNGISTGLSITPEAPVYLHDARGLSAYTHVDVLYEAYFMAYLVLNTINAPFNPGNPYTKSKTQNGFGTLGQPDVVTTMAAAAREALNAVWLQKWFVHLRHRPESGGAIVYLAKTGQANTVEGQLSSVALNSNAVQTSYNTNHSYFLSQAFPEGSPTHPSYPTGHGTVAGACITVLKFFFDGTFNIPNPQVPSPDGQTLSSYSDASLDVNGELNKLARNISFGHGIHAGIHWRSDTDTSIEIGEAVALSYLRNLAKTYNENFTVTLQKVDGSTATISNE
ncbi:MAG: hypothetical protein JO340_03315 [Acidobacteriaceae bacterium]|nr:hypothetical protein [Acidobacteriaceae bacterium]